jgi:hypothetical protein
MGVFGVLVTLQDRRRWPRSSPAAAIAGVTAIATSFAIVGACIEFSLDKPEWLQAPGALWSAIFTAFGMFVWGAVLAGPWFVTHMLADASREQSEGSQRFR